MVVVMMIPSSMFFLFLFLLPLFSVAAIIKPGSVLYASNPQQSWSSDNQTFSLGFLPLTPQTSPPSFLAAISYSGGVPIWTAGTASVDSGASLHFRSTGNLQLLNGSGDSVWDSNTQNLGVSTASLEENGNLVLNNSTTTVWSTFDHPVNTIVQTQNFTVGKTLRSGVYSFSLLQSGNITLRWNDSVTYWSKGLNSSYNSNNTSLASPSLELQTIGTLSVFDQTLPAVGAVIVYSDDDTAPGDLLRFLKLDDDGNLRIYSSQKGSGTKTEGWAAVEDQCRVYGFCGDMGICSYNATSPVCGCPSQNFEPVDQNDDRKGCRRKIDIEDCAGNVTMLDFEHTLLLTYPPQSIFAGGTESEVFYAGVSACRLNCLNDLGCEGSTLLSDGSGQCYFKRPGFITGYWNPSLPSTSHIKVCPPVIQNPLPSSQLSEGDNGWKVDGWILIVEGLAIILGLICLEAGLWLCCCRNNRKFGALSGQYTLLEYASGAPVQFSYKELVGATKGFKEKLGAGGFGSVYKGVLANGMTAAVKQLEGIEQGERQFRMEVATISSSHHLNLVRLIGFCAEGRHRLLVYEFMKNGSLDQFLFITNDNQTGTLLLNWEQRFRIALGTARAITYLHEECHECIVHCDIKPENILLDENYTAKVSDFGLAKLMNSKENRYKTLASIRGTRGYLAPEWIANLPITSKSDIYSYGMVLLEIVSGRRNFEMSAETNMKKFSVWAYEEYEKGDIMRIVDRRLHEQQLDVEQVKRAIQVSFWCIQEQPSQRPQMGKVVQMLEGVIEIEQPAAPVANPDGGGGRSMVYFSGSISTDRSHTASAPAATSFSSSQVATHSSSVAKGGHNSPSSSLLFSRN